MIVSIVLWLWLTMRIWKSSTVGAVFTFFLGLPAIYFLLKYWDDEEGDIRVPFFVNLITTIVYLFMLLNAPTYKPVDREKEAGKPEIAANPEMARWCRDKFGAVYDELLGTCIEHDPNSDTAGAGAASDVMEQLSRHFAKNGVETHFEELEELPPIGAQAAMPRMTRMVQFEIETDSIFPTALLIGECASRAVCEDAERIFGRRNSPLVFARNENLLFLAKPDSSDARQIGRAREIFRGFVAM